MFQKATHFLQKIQHNFKYKEGQEGWSHVCGGVSGEPFQYLNKDYALVGVRGKYNLKGFTKLQFLFIDKEGKYQMTPEIGTEDGENIFEYECKPGEWISKVFVWSGFTINALQFRTNGDSMSTKYGVQGGSSHIIDTYHPETKGVSKEVRNPSRDRRICGVKGRFSKQIDQLCFAIGA